MHTPRMIRPTLAAAMALCLPVLCVANVAPADERVVGGVYSNACNDGSALRVRLFGDVMSVERAGKAVAAKPFSVSKSHPGGAPPADFKIAYVGQVKGGDGLVFVMVHNADGLFVILEGGAKSLAPLGTDVVGQKLRHCDPNRNALPGAPVAQPLSPSALLRDPKFKAAYLAALGPLSRDAWLAKLNGPAPDVRKVQFAGNEYQLASVCKPHDCSENNAVLLYGAATGVVYGKVYQAGRSTLFGHPAPAIASELDRIWKLEWRR